MISVAPIEISGDWFQGFALDLHTTSSAFSGYNEFGHETFDTKRSELGELLYKLKYRRDKSGFSEISEVAANFVKGKWGIAEVLDCIVPIPPSNTARAFQPVLEVAKGMSSRLGIPMYEDALIKNRKTLELKDVAEYSSRLRILENAFTAKTASTVDKRILLFDDLYRSGATLTVATRVLYHEGKAAKIYVLALTKTRSKS